MATVKPPFIPNFKKNATVTEAPAAEAPVEVDQNEQVAPNEEVKKTRKKSDKERKTPNKQMTAEDIQFVVENVRGMSYSEIATARGITKHQVNRVLMEAKKNLREVAKDDPAKLAKVENYIKEYLSRPEDTLPGGAGRSSVVRDSIEDIVSGIISQL